MTKEQEFFCNNVKIILSPQEKQGKNEHILNKLDLYKIKYEKLYAPNHLKQGDYSFVVMGKDYRNEFLIERKFGLEELYQCLTGSNIDTKAKQSIKSVHNSVGAETLRDNLEAEFVRMLALNIKEKWLFIENCDNFESIKTWGNGYERRNQLAGEMIYATLCSWSCANRYDFKIKCIADKKDFTNIMLIKMFYYWRNEQKKLYGKNFLTKLNNLVKGG